MNSWLATSVAVIISLTLTACGTGGIDSGGGGSENFSPLWVAIDKPYNSTAQTSEIELSGTASCDNCPPPAAALGYCPVGQPTGDSAIHVTWRNTTTGATGDTYHSINPLCACILSWCYTSYAHTWFAQVPLTIGKNDIVIRATDRSGGSGKDSVTIMRIPETIQGLTATSGTGQITLNWNPVAGATSYNLYWSQTSRNVTENVTKIVGVSMPYIHTGLAEDATYYYVLTVEVNGNESLPSRVVWATSGWVVEPLATTTATTRYEDTSIAMDTRDNVHIHYSYDEKIGTAAYRYNSYMTNASGVWGSVPVDRPSWVNAGIALDSRNTVHVSFLDFPGLTHATSSSRSWVPEVADSNGQCDASFALDSADKAHITYFGSTGLLYATNTTGSWVSTVVEANAYRGCPGSGEVSLAVEADGTAHIIYAGKYPDYGLKYATNRGGTWAVFVVDTGYVAETAVAVDLNGRTHLVYTDNLNHLKYAHNVSGTWSIEDIHGEGSPRYPSLALDATGKAHVSYHSSGYGELHYATNATGAWRIIPIDSGLKVLFQTWATSAIALDSQSRVHISYFRIGRLAYATNR